MIWIHVWIILTFDTFFFFRALPLPLTWKWHSKIISWFWLPYSIIIFSHGSSGGRLFRIWKNILFIAFIVITSRKNSNCSFIFLMPSLLVLLKGLHVNNLFVMINWSCLRWPDVLILRWFLSFHTSFYLPIILKWKIKLILIVN